MKITTAAIACLVAISSLASSHQATARTQQELMKVCADEWNSLKAANRTADKVYQDFVRECLERHKEAAGEKPDASATATSKVNLNTATVAELGRLPHIGESRAKAIIEARTKAKFKDWEDFVARKVVPSSAETAIKDLVNF